MTKTLAEWDAKVRPHLNGIRDGSEMCARHANHLLQKPLFDTLAFDDLERIEAVLADAIVKVRHAKQTYEAKPSGD